MPPERAPTFGELLRQHRRAAGLSQEELAVRARLSLRGVSDLERGLRRTPREETVALLADALGLAPSQRAALASSVIRARPSRPAAGAPLPAALTSFIGRERELAELHRLCEAARLVTLTGAGGVGKTRLALQLAWQVLDRFADGVWLVDLAPLTDSRLVARAVAVAIGLPEAPEQAAVPAIVAALRQSRLLLVVDNCEHLLDGCADVIAAVLSGCPEVRVLTTSRQSLGITGELVWRVPSLGAPGDTTSTLEQLCDHDSVRLFVDRAKLANPRFRLTERNAAAVALICRQLDGIPLALELAAARLKALGVEQLAARLDRQFRLLTGGSRAALPRQRTLGATIDWSYDLLDRPERLLFRRVARFAGGWTLEATEAVCAGQDIAPADVVDLLLRLADKSLVLAEEQPDGVVRYRLLEPLRQYGLERLAASGEADAVAARHACYFLVLAKALEPRLESGDRDAALARLDAEHANLRRALGWCHAAGECGRKEAVEIGLGLSGRLFWFWYFRGRLPEACRWTEALLALPAAAAPAARARALLTAGRAAWLLGEDQIARQRLEEGAALWRRVGDGAGPALAQTLVILGMVTEAPGAARAALDEGEALFRALGDAWGLALALRMQGLRAFQRGDDDDARRWMEEGLALSRALRDRWFVAQTLNHLGDVARRQGNYAGAAARYEESLALFQAQGVRGGIPSLLHNLGHVALAGGDAGRAVQLFWESLRLFREQGDGRGVAHCLAGLAGTLGARQPEAAAQLFGAADGLLAGMGAGMGPSNQADYARTVAAVQDHLPPATFAAAWAAGEALSADEAMAFALDDSGERSA